MCPAESATWMVKANDWAGESGVPETVAVVVGVLLNDTLCGSVPEVTVQVNGATPPVALMVWSYATHAVPFGSDAVVITSG